MNKPHRIKFLSKTPLEKMAPLWSALLPKFGFPDVEFIFDPDERDYDFLVIYEDFPPFAGEKKILRQERLACPKTHTLLITTEPSSIRIDGLNYLSQFGEVWTSRKFNTPAILKLQSHGCQLPQFSNENSPDHAYQTPPLRWFYGRDMEGDNHLSLEQIATEQPEKIFDLSTVTSNKDMNHTVHAKRLEFSRALKARMGDELHLFGRGFNAVRDKRDAMENYKYHIAIENHIQSGHHTEKLTDCFLGLCLPFYFGDPDYTRAYPPDAVIPIDIFDIEKSEAVIRTAIASNQYEKRINSLKAAKKIALAHSNPLNRVTDWALDLQSRGEYQTSPLGTGVIYGRHVFRKAHPVQALVDLRFRTKMRRKPSSSPLQFGDR